MYSKIPYFKAAIFDLDGTILDSMPYWFTTGERYLSSLGVKPEKNISKIMQSMSLAQGAQYFREKYGIQKTDSQIIQGIKETISDSYRFEIQPKPFAIDFLELIRKSGIPIALATATDENMFMPAFERLNLRQYFDHILTCSQLNTSKNEPLIYLSAAKLLKTSVEQTVVFEDAPHAISTAYKAGFKTAGIQDDSAKNQEDEVKQNSTVYFADYKEAISFFFNQ